MPEIPQDAPGLGVELEAPGLGAELADGILRLTLDRQSRMNALDARTSSALCHALESAGEDPAVRVVVITGAGAAFSTGADIADMATGATVSGPPTSDTGAPTSDTGPPTSDTGAPESAAAARATAEQTMARAARLVRAIIELPVPVVAQVNGPAAGIGVSIALAADLVYAAESAYFLLAFTGVGLMPDGASSLLVPAAIGRARANAMAFLAQPMSAADAVASGLINEVLPDADLRARVDSVTRRIASGPRRALELTKRAMTASTLALLDDTLRRESDGQIELLTAPDFREGIAAVLGHRRPNFRSEPS